MCKIIFKLMIIAIQAEQLMDMFSKAAPLSGTCSILEKGMNQYSD